MITGAAWLAILAVFSGLSMNVILQFGLGLKGIAFDKNISKEDILAGSALLFVTVMLLWLFFFFLRSFLFLGFFEYILLFPTSCLFFSVFEYLMNRFIMEKIVKRNKAVVFDGVFSAGAPLGGAVVGTALFITLNIAGGFFEAVILSLGFTVGAAFAIIALGEIRRRSEMEAVPRWLRGGPLALVAMGLLSLIFSSGAIMFFEVLGG